MIDDDELVRRINLLEVLGEDHEDVAPPPEDAARDWCAARETSPSSFVEPPRIRKPATPTN